jgi:hypothetical protein
MNLYFPPERWESHEKFITEMKVTITTNPSWFRLTELSKEEKRAALGCFYLFSWVCDTTPVEIRAYADNPCQSSAKLSRLNPLHWNIHIHQYYEDILKTPENDNDIYLAYLIDLHRIAENVKNIGGQRPWTGSMEIHLKLLMSELERFKVSLPESLQLDCKPKHNTL